MTQTKSKTKSDKLRGRARLDLRGHKYGLLTPISWDWRDNVTYWTCRCDCGGLTEVAMSNLRPGKVRSCGCLLRQRPRGPDNPSYKHGLSHSWHYPRWHMWKRGMGSVPLCPAWAKSLPEFVKAVGDPPFAGACLAPLDLTQPLGPGNFFWAHRKELVGRIGRRITHNGVTKSMAGWAREVGVTREAMRQRLAKGWPVALAVTTPFNQGNRSLLQTTLKGDRK